MLHSSRGYGKNIFMRQRVPAGTVLGGMFGGSTVFAVVKVCSYTVGSTVLFFVRLISAILPHEVYASRLRINA